ncbi:hypothetical protein C4564_05810 [Candidatus Microgenomates bacterium]|nr:MAG: hypothetical protein C4564_05810 [Candidatus Microgenomates bacterium]
MYSMSSSEAHGRAHFELDGSTVPFPKTGDTIGLYLVFDQLGQLVSWEEGNYGTVPMDSFHISTYADGLNLFSLGFGSHVPAAVVEGHEGYHYLLLPDGRIAQYIIPSPDDKSI